MRVRAALVALFAAAVVACGSDERGGSSTLRTAPATTRPPDARVFGVVLAGPTCPVVTPEEPCPPRPVDAEISAQDGEGAIVASTRTDADGDYTLSLEPGDYTLVADTGGGAAVLRSGHGVGAGGSVGASRHQLRHGDPLNPVSPAPLRHYRTGALGP